MPRARRPAPRSRTPARKASARRSPPVTKGKVRPSKPTPKPVAKPTAKVVPKAPPKTPPRPSAPAPQPAPPAAALALPLPGGRRHVLSLSFVRDGDEFLARMESDSGHITELKNRSLDQLLTLVAGELEDLLE
jgi:hypothetical protein